MIYSSVIDAKWDKLECFSRHRASSIHLSSLPTYSCSQGHRDKVSHYLTFSWPLSFSLNCHRTTLKLVKSDTFQKVWAMRPKKSAVCDVVKSNDTSLGSIRTPKARGRFCPLTLYQSHWFFWGKAQIASNINNQCDLNWRLFLLN